LSVLLRFPSSGYHLPIFKLVLHSIDNTDSHSMFISEHGDVILNIKMLNGYEGGVVFVYMPFLLYCLDLYSLPTS
jgi:hypothetical protein